MSDANGIVDELRLRRFARVAARLLPGAATQGAGPRAAQNRAGPGLEFQDVRRYAPGDDLRHVDWRQTSRRRRAMVRRYRDESASDWTLCVDGSASMGLHGKWRTAAELSSALAYVLLYAGHRVALAVFAERMHAYCLPGRGQHQFANILRQLVNYTPPSEGGDSLPGTCARMVSPSGGLVLLSDFLRPDAMANDLRRLRARANFARAIQVLSDGDAAVSANGPARLIDIENRTIRRLAVTKAAQGAAKDALLAHNRRLRSIILALDMPFSSCVAGDDWETVLAQHLGA
jgi:uncharacterized protein (DUF58 family)